MKYFAFVLTICVVLSGCGQQLRDLRPIYQQLGVAANAHDVDAVMKLVADDAVLIDPMGATFTGKEAVRGWVQGVMPGFHVESWGVHQSGDTLRWWARLWGDAFAQSGVVPVTCMTTAVIAGDKIKHFSTVLTDETQGKMKFAQFYAEVVNKGNVDAFDNYVADQFVEHQPLPPGTPPGKEGVKAYFKMLKEGFPDMKATPIMFLADGDRILAYAKWEGTNTGRFMGKPATNRKISYEGMDIIAFKDGKATEHWGIADDATMMRQLAGK